MKAIYKNIAFAALALSAVACTQDNSLTTSHLNDPDAVRIHAQVANAEVTGGFTRSNPIGTETEQKAFNDGDQITVSVGEQTAVTYQLSNQVWNPVGEDYLKWESDNMTFAAWYPVADGTDTENFTPVYGEIASLAELQANDYMTFSGEKEKSDDKSITLEMVRQMVRFVIDGITYGSQYNSTDNAVTSIAITAGSSKYVDGIWDDANVTAQMFLQDGKWYAVLPPTATGESEEIFLSVTLNGVTNPLTVKGISATEAGNSYSFTLTLGKDKATVGEPKVNPWNSDEITGGAVEEVRMGDITDPAQAKKGDFVMKDGSFISYSEDITLTDKQKANVAGIVFWTTADSNTSGNTPANLTDDKIMAIDFKDCTHGLIVSLTDVATNCAWQGIKVDTDGQYYESVLQNFQQTEHFNVENKDKYVDVTGGTTTTDNCNKILGYNNTKILEAYNAYCAANGKSNYIVKPIAELVTWKTSNPYITGTTGWFIPSVKELVMLFHKDMDDVYNYKPGADDYTARKAVNASLAKIDDSYLITSYYWSSSEIDEKKAFNVVGVNLGSYNKYNYSNFHVRAVCAY